MTGRNMVAGQMTSTLNDWNVAPNSIRHKQLIEMQTKLSRYLLVQQGDSQSMSHGVEQRFPFLDEDLVDFLFSLPDQQFEELSADKKLLRDYMKGLLPDQVVQRKKQGYLAPMKQKLYDSKVFSQLVNLAASEKVRLTINLYFDLSEVKKLLTAYKEKTLSDTETIMLLLIISTYVLHE